MSAPEFSRPLRIDRIGEGETTNGIEADAAERAALSERFAIRAIDRLDATFAVHRDAVGIVATGRLCAQVTQLCVATGEPVQATIDEPFTIRFLPIDTPVEDEVELDEASADTMFYDGSAIDLGEAAAETLALALDPYPRSPNADAVLKQAGVLSEEEAGPFSALAALRDKLR